MTMDKGFRTHRETKMTPTTATFCRKGSIAEGWGRLVRVNSRVRAKKIHEAKLGDSNMHMYDTM